MSKTNTPEIRYVSAQKAIAKIKNGNITYRQKNFMRGRAVATTLPGNKPMIALCRKFFPELEIDNSGDDLVIWMRFADAGGLAK